MTISAGVSSGFGAARSDILFGFPSPALLCNTKARNHHQNVLRAINKDSCIYSTCPYTAVQSQKAVSDYFTSKHIGEGRAKRDIGQSRTLKF